MASCRKFLPRRILRCVPGWRTSVALCFSLAAGQSFAASQTDEARELFESTNLIQFQVELDDAEYQQLAQRPGSYVSGTVRVAGRTFEQVGIRLKGTGTFQPINKHPSLSLKLNWKLPGQEFAGMSKVFLENSGQDATRLCKMVSSGAFTDAKIPASRITQVRVDLNHRDLGLYPNHRDLGLYVVTEGINKHFLKRHFQNSEGNLYEAEFQEIGPGLKQENGPPGDHSDRRALRS